MHIPMGLNSQHLSSARLSCRQARTPSLGRPHICFRYNIFIMNEANMTGINTKMGSLMTAKIKPYKTLTENEMIQEIFAHMISEAVVEIRSESSVVHDQKLSLKQLC